MKKIQSYIIVSYGFSWSLAFIVKLLGGFSDLGPYAIIPLFLYMCGPAVGALVCVFFYEKGRRVEALGVSGPFTWYFLIAWLIGIGLLIGALFITLLASNISLADPVQSNMRLFAEANLSAAQREAATAQLNMPHIGVILFGASLFLGPLLNWPIMASEELGWRGYLWDQLKSKGFWSASWITGGLWGLWHVPIILLGHNYPTMPVFGSVIFIGLCLLMGPIYSWIRLKSGSIWGPCLLHGTTNGAAGYFLLLQSSMEMPWKGLLGIGGFIALFISVLLVWYAKRKTSLTITP